MYVLIVESDWYTSYMCTLNIRLRSESAFHNCMALVRMVFDQSCPQVAPSIMMLCVRPALRSAWIAVMVSGGSSPRCCCRKARSRC